MHILLAAAHFNPNMLFRCSVYVVFSLLLLQVLWYEVASMTEGGSVEDCQCEDSIKTMTQEIVNELKAIREAICDKDTCDEQRVYRDCKALQEAGTTQSGVYSIKPDSGDSFQVYCDMDTNGGGWTVFQRRKNGSIDFYRNWSDYKQGFGDLSGEFWLGLDKIHRLTSSTTSNTLRVDLRDFANEARYAEFSSFNIGDEASKYTISVTGYSGTAGERSQPPGNNGRVWNGMKFSTKDQDNDNSVQVCAVDYEGAWWYNSCYDYNLNGKYMRTPQSLYDGIRWLPWKEDETLMFTEMKCRSN